MPRFDESFRLNLSERMKKTMEAVAKAEDISQSELVRMAIDEYLQDATTTPEEELAIIREDMSEAKHEAEQYQKKAKEQREQLEELKNREKELAEQIEQISELDTLDDLLKRVVQEAVEKDGGSISPYNTLVEDISAEFTIEGQELINRIYTEYPAVGITKFQQSEVSDSLSREWPEEYKDMLGRVARLTRWRGETTSSQVWHVADKYEMEADELVRDVSEESDDLDLTEKSTRLEGLDSSLALTTQ